MEASDKNTVQRHPRGAQPIFDIKVIRNLEAALTGVIMER